MSIFASHYMMPIAAPLFAMLGTGLAALSRLGPARQMRLAPGVLLCLATLPLGAAHARDLVEPGVQREHWRWVADYLHRNSAPDDPVVVFADYAEPVLMHHFDGPNPVLRYTANPRDPGPVFDALAAKGGRTLWLVLAHDRVADAGHQLVETASGRYPWIRAEYPNRGFIRVLGYALRSRVAALPAEAVALDSPVSFSNGLQLVGYQADPLALPATERISHPPSNWLHVRLYWRRNGVWREPHARPTLRLTGAEGDWGGELMRIPGVFEFDPPRGWPEGALVVSEHDINLNPATPPGDYALRVSMRSDADAPVALTTGGEWLTLRDIRILAR